MASPNIRLKGKKVILRQISLRDAQRFCRWLADPEVVNTLAAGDSSVPTLRAERDWIRQARREKNKVIFSIDTLDGVHIGSVSLFGINPRHRRAEYGVMIGDKRYWDQGCGTEAGRLMLGYGFRKLKLHRIYLHLIAYNFRGLRSYQKLGFKVEGKMRQHLWHHGYWHNRIAMGILRDEFIHTKQQTKKTYGR